jgi:hypothetical protein
MKMPGSALWRLCFILSALCLMAGGPQHPGGTMAEMLGDRRWVPAHSLFLAGFVLLLAGLLLYSRTLLPERTRRWLRFAVAGTILQAVEMAFHTAAVVDHDHLVAGILFPLLLCFALWLILAGVWPLRVRANQGFDGERLN